MSKEKTIELPVGEIIPTSRLGPGVLPPTAAPYKFQKGVSGNPGGRPVKKPFRDALLKAIQNTDGDYKPKTELEKIAFNLITIAKSSGKGAVHAIKEIIDRVDGKAVPSEEELDAKKQSGKIILVNSNKTEIKQ
jgi:hypothetical protein